MTGSNEFEDRARKLKAAQLEVLALDRGVSAEQLENPAVRAELLGALSALRGKPVTASLATWRKLWQRLRRAELAGEHPQYAKAVGAEAPYSTVPGRNPFARAS